VITTLSAAGVNGAFVAADDTEIGSRGRSRPTLTASVAPLGNIAVSTTASSAVVTFAPSATDNVSAPANHRGVSTTVGHKRFPIGVTTVSCKARDEAGNESATVTFT